MSEPSSVKRPGIAAVVLTFNSSLSIERTLIPLAQVADEIHVVDSFSSDDTLDICRRHGCKIVQRKFLHYADQRNWAIDTLQITQPWQLHVDADEELTPELVAEIQALDLASAKADGWMIARKIVFMGRVLRHGVIAKTWHLRLFRSGFGRCEDRLYDQHFVGSGTIARLDAAMLDHQEMTLSEWTQRHNRWSDLETAELLGTGASAMGKVVEADPDGDLIQKKRYLKQRYYTLPLFLRSFSYFVYRYVLRLGFLDGREGLIYHVLQGFWFRFLIDAKLYEHRREASGGTKA